MNFHQIVQDDSQNRCNPKGSLRNKAHPWLRRSLRSMRRHRSSDVTAPEMLSRGPKQVTRCHSNSFVDYSDPERTRVVLEKQDNGTFGFEIQTYGMQRRSSAVVEMCTFVCKVQEDSAAQRAGINIGDIIVEVNGVCIEGANHQHIVNLIRESSSILTLETVSGTVVKRIELEKKLRSLKQSLKEKLAELQTLTLEELRITGADLSGDSSCPSLGSPMSLASPVGQGSCRLSSVSSYRSVMTEDGEDSVALSYMFDYPNPSDTPCREITDSAWETCPGSIDRTGSSGSLSSSSDLWGLSLFGTLPRRAKQAVVRRRLLKFIPGLNNSVEEEVDS